MRYAIVESGGKQYRVVEGGTLDVDRLPVEAGKELNLESILLMADGDEVMVGNPIVGGILVKTRVLAHVKGPKVVSFKYRPKKRIRVKGGHRHQYTRLMVDFIGRPGEERKREEAPKPVETQEPAAVVPAAKAPKARATKQPAKSSKTPAKKSTTGRPPSAEKKSTAAKKTTKK
ncbi:MAG: 50S ribosomal protein L21 [Bacteroidota bacterium]